ncbi:DUF5753 domain-containing protein [Nocardiopsis chromatogenes]|uniref:DUF5753 domain-containing protein n=1 Tax=Nocardiopsis chromatogenes TaxID=280239 RepID=UPI001EF9FBB5|nr:DUF5753 domain-containing protein [Nocardiopsis chromatogenes]
MSAMGPPGEGPTIPRRAGWPPSPSVPGRPGRPPVRGRQAILNGQDRPELWAVIDEAALLRLGDGEMMREQVQHLIDVAEDTSNSVTIQVLGIDAGLHAGVGGPFVLLDFDEGMNALVYIETDTDGLYLVEASEVERYRKLLLHIQVAAMKPPRSLAYLKDMLT